MTKIKNQKGKGLTIAGKIEIFEFAKRFKNYTQFNLAEKYQISQGLINKILKEDEKFRSIENVNQKKNQSVINNPHLTKNFSIGSYRRGLKDTY